MRRFAQLVWGKNYRSVRKTTYRIDGQKLITRQHLPRLYSRTLTTTLTNSLIKKKNERFYGHLHPYFTFFCKERKKSVSSFSLSQELISWEGPSSKQQKKTAGNLKTRKEEAARMRCSQNKHKWIRSHLNTQAEQKWNEGEKRGQLPKLENGGILMGTTSMDSIYKLHYIYIHTWRKVPSTKAKEKKRKKRKRL